MRQQVVTIEIHGLGEFQSLREHVAFWTRATRTQCLAECREALSAEGYAVARTLPKHELVIVVAGILHATN